jgi:AcrR family transcriptional regulator
MVTVSSRDSPEARRRGSAPRRHTARRGADTRRRVEEAAANRFTRDGYTASTMQAIADDAGVHVQTVYLAYGTKSALLAACAARLVAGTEDPETHPSERRWARAIASEPDPRAKLALYVKHIADVAPRITPLLDVLRATAPAEPDVAAFLAHMENARRQGPLELLGRGIPPDTWRPGLTPDEVADIVSTLASPDTLRSLIDRCGWHATAAAAWIVRVLERELLGA